MVSAILGTILSYNTYKDTKIKILLRLSINRGEGTMGKKRMTFWMEDRQVEALKALSSMTRVKQADYIREGIDMVPNTRGI